MGTARPPGAPRIVPSAPATGVLWAVREAMAQGFAPGHPDWINLGQGQPELGPLPGAPARVQGIALSPADHAYGPVTGLDALRTRIAEQVNRVFRPGRPGGYTAAHVAVAGGGRVAFSRVLAALGPGRVGYITPDYPAIDEGLRRAAGRLVPVHVPSRAEDGFLPRPEVLEKAFAAGLDAFVLSHPNNPTGSRYEAADLERIVAAARRHDTLLVLDEFYGHYVYDADGRTGGGAPVSGAAHVVDVDRDPVVLIDGLTKAFRYPGWRLAWMVGPPALVDAVARAGGGLDGGASVPVQRAAIDLLEPAAADAETRAVRAVFAAKRDRIAAGLADLGLALRPPPATFYAFADLSGLPAPYDDADHFFRAALDERVVSVPGRLFDLDPAASRSGPSPFASWLRFSFGPPLAVLDEGLARLARVVARIRSTASRE
jgi:aspartate/methionine/tyrosine aminotransferase